MYNDSLMAHFPKTWPYIIAYSLDLGITSKLGQWFYHFLTNRKHFVRLPGGL